MHLIFIAVCVLSAFWLRQIASLMSMSDAEFPGRHDKVIWAVILLALPVVGAALFVYWKRGRSTR